MKELSIEEKAKRYDEAIKIAKDNFNGFIRADVVFPELAESEDEKIRKAIVKYVSALEWKKVYGVLRDDMLAWLEKMKLNPYTGVGFKYNGQTWGMCARDGGIDILVDSKLISHIDIRQGELETKLKIEEGKWYICISQFCNCIEGRVYKATSDSRIMDDFGTEYDMHSDAYKYFRLWTIQDAKDGDVLSYRNGQWIFIYKEKIDDSSFYYHTLYSTIHQDLVIDDIGFTLLDDAIVPATEEQRDTLFAKIYEANYEWDAEKKELKKIEQNQVIDYPDNLPKDNWELIQEFVNKFGRIPKDEDELNVLVEYVLKRQKPTEWSEEDDKIISRLHDIIFDCKTFGKFGVTVAEYSKLDNCLKSIKDRVQPQSQWRPSESQMKWLHDAMESTQYEPRKQALISLYSDLMKLKD